VPIRATTLEWNLHLKDMSECTMKVQIQLHESYVPCNSIKQSTDKFCETGAFLETV
jgi:hypothetical protein